MHRARAANVIKATVRLKILAKQARERVANHVAENAVDEETGLLRTEGVTATVTDGDATENGLYTSKGVPIPLQIPLSKTKETAWHRKDYLAIKEFLLANWLNLLLFLCPVAGVAHFLHLDSKISFSTSFLGLIPLAVLLGDVTEDLALRYGDIAGGLLNATFGNVVELILSIAALRRGLYDVVSSSLLGSILSNLLLVLGCCFLFGGFRFSTQHFNELANKASSSLLFLSCIGIIVPTSADHLLGGDDLDKGWILSISRGTAVVLIITYICYLTFQLRTHKQLFQSEEEGDEAPLMTLFGSILCLTVITAIVAMLSEILTGSIEDFSKATGIGKPFLGLIVLPIAGNACEHITAVVVAYKNKMDLAIGVAVGSSIQIAIFVIPFVVLVGWATNHPFSLDFDPFATLALTLSVIHANFVTADATSHWLMGVQLIATYLLIAITFLYL